MRITKNMLKESNERKRVIIFVLLVVCFVLSVTVSIQFKKLNDSICDLTDLTEKTNSDINKTYKQTQKIQNILTIGEE